MTGFNGLFSMEKNPFIIVILLGFLQEASNGISMVAIQYLYKDEFRLNPSDASFIDSFSMIPWIIKPLWGYISDSFHFFGYRRKSYLIFFSVMQILSWCLLLSFTNVIYIGILCLFMLSFGGAFINVICEALLVQITQSSTSEKNETEKQSEASDNVSTYFGARYFGSFLTVFSGGVLLENINKQTIFSISAVFALMSGLSAFFLYEIKQVTTKTDKNSSEIENEVGNEEKVRLHVKNEENHIEANNDIENEEKTRLHVKNEENNLKPQQEVAEEKTNVTDKKSRLSLLFDFFTKKQILYPVCFIFLLTVRPSSNQAIFFFYTNGLSFDPEFIGVLQLVHSCGSILGVYIYNKFFKFVGFKKFFCCTTIIYVILDLSQIILVTRYNKNLGIPDQVFCIIDSLMTDFIMELNLFPLLIIACRLSPKNIEGTMYALMMSIFNFSGMLGTQIGGLLMRLLGITEKNFRNLYLLILITNIWVFSVLPFIFLADFESAHITAGNPQKKTLEGVTSGNDDADGKVTKDELVEETDKTK